MEFQDKTLICSDCGSEFPFTRNEQAFYAERGFTNEPKRCKNCRDKRRGSRDGGGRERAMVTITCDDCGETAEVPFQLVSGNSVYCRSCYSQRRGSMR